MGSNFKLCYHLLKNFLFGVKFPLTMSVDITNRCNLRCKHCYFFQQNYRRELSKEELLGKIKEIKSKNPSIIQMNWIGGEPLLRAEIIEEGMKLFPFNMIVTNGTIELPKWKNFAFYVSVDGTKKYHDKNRGLKIYDKIKGNIENRDDINVSIACVLTKQNYSCVQDMLKEWSKTSIKGINFDFYTPIKGIKEDLWLNWKERDEIIYQLLELRKEYDDFLLNPEPVLKLMLSENSKKITSNCIMPKSAISLDPMGNRKLPCILGSKADCSRCGCVIPFIYESILVKRQRESLYLIYKFNR